MKVSGSDDYWQQIRIHTHNRLSMGSPWSVQLHAAALLGDHRISASWTGYTSNQPSLWTVVAVTDDDRLIRLQLEFDAEQYDRDAEQRLQRLHQSVGTAVHDASVHRLRDAVNLSIGRALPHVDGWGKPSRDEVDVSDIRLQFSDGSEIDLGIDQTTIYDTDDRARSDALIEAIRTQSGL